MYEIQERGPRGNWHRIAHAESLAFALHIGQLASADSLPLYRYRVRNKGGDVLWISAETPIRITA